MSEVNPFRSVGRVVTGASFFGRSQVLDVLSDRLAGAGTSGNVSLVGCRRMGKSSVLAEFNRRYGATMDSNGKVWVEVKGSVAESPEQFFYLLVRTAQRRISDRVDDRRLFEAAAGLEDVEGRPWVRVADDVQQYFGRVAELGLDVVLVLDEFDHTAAVFGDRVAPFQLLRDLCSEPPARVTLVTASRNAISDIEKRNPSVSTLDGISNPLWITPMPQGDVQAMLAAAGVRHEGKGRAVTRMTGGHPYLLGTVANAVMTSGGEAADIDLVLASTEMRVRDHLRTLLDNVVDLDGVQGALAAAASGSVEVGLTAQDAGWRLATQLGLIVEGRLFCELFSEVVRAEHAGKPPMQRRPS